MVTAAETEQGRRVESKIKTLTGGDKIFGAADAARFFEFTPQFTLWIYGNHKPGLKSVNVAIRRGIRLVPFTITFQMPKATRNFGVKTPSDAGWMNAV